MRQECSNEEQDQSAAPVGRELAAARARRGYTLRQLSELTRIPESVLHAWEHGDTACGPAERYRAQVSAADGEAVMTLHHGRTNAEVLRVQQPDAADPRLGFSADSQVALLTWRRADGEHCVEAWNL